MNRKSTIELHKLDAALYQSRSGTEAARGAAIRQMWRELRASLRRPGRIDTAVAAPAAA